jgi:hypothetical protein
VASKRYPTHYSGAPNVEINGTTWATPRAIACGVPRAIDRHAAYFATADPAAVTCKRCLGAKIMSFVTPPQQAAQAAKE